MINVDENPWAIDPPAPPTTAVRSAQRSPRVSAAGTSVAVLPPAAGSSVDSPVDPGPGWEQSPAWTASQTRVFDELLSIGTRRPVCPPGIAEQLRDRLAAAVSDAVALWPESSLWLSKSALFSVEQCEGSYLASRQNPGGAHVSSAIVVGQVSHRGIQLSYTHPGRSPEWYARSALASCCTDAATATWWEQASPGTQSDIIVQAISRVTTFLDSWPPLQPEWVPRFEEPMSVRIGKVTVSGRPDVVLGRPRGDGTQTMLITDVKSSALREDHTREGQLYALLSTLRHGVPPFRSCVYSLSSGEWTEPDVDVAVLTETADWLAARIVSIVDVLTESRPPLLTPESWCRFCPVVASCTAAVEAAA